MDELTLWKIRNKYKNNVFPRLPYLLINFLNNNHQNYLDLILTKYLTVDDVIFFIKFKEINTEEDLVNLTIRFLELKHGILK